ncbi:MAG: DUF1844 domain-containing protein [Myxococcales bacterium]|nr:MAG: DUF1844 domain-containing protein [Myxococcales bacterium]
MAGNDADNEGFTVTDKRVSAESENEQDAASEPAAGTGRQSLPPIDFMTFILSLSTSALVELGHDTAPDSKDSAEPNLGMARQTIDLLALLQTKTKGNLSGEEERFLDHILTELRMRYVAKSKSVASK